MCSIWKGVSVDNFYRENKEIYLQRFENGIKYFSDKKGRENNGLSQGQNTLIYKKDTMKIHIEPIPYHLIMGIKRVHFQKPSPLHILALATSSKGGMR